MPLPPPRRITRYFLAALVSVFLLGILLKSDIASIWRELPAIKQKGESILWAELQTLQEQGAASKQQWSPETQFDFKPGVPIRGYNYTRRVVVPKTKHEHVEWLDQELPDVPKAIYVVDDKHAALHPPKNKGNEVMVYLSYLIDHYDNLTDVNIFIHAHRYAWHNNDLLDGDTAQMIRYLNSERVIREGYMNLRCQWFPGCPAWLRPNPLQEDPEKKEEKYVAKVWSELFPAAPLPEVLGQPCCSQFALSKERIRAMPRAEYLRLRNWFMETRLSSSMSGRVFEYIWQYLFTAQTTLCTGIHACYCDGYGACFASEEDFQSWFKTRFELRESEWELHSWMENEDKYQDFMRRGKSRQAATVERAPKGRIADLQLGIRQRWVELDEKRQVALERGKDPKERARVAGREWTEQDAWNEVKDQFEIPIN